MPPKTQNAQKKRQRVHTTNKAREAQQFSTVRLPRTSEIAVQKVNVDAMHAEVRGVAPAASGASPAHREGAGAQESKGPSPTFDPIPNDPMFYIVEESQYWPPPSLAELQKSTGVAVVGVDGFDAYDRRADDAAAKKEKAKIVKGELNHPRGKERKNKIVKLSDSSSDDE